MVGHALSMVARAHGDNARGGLRCTELGEFVAGTTFLERRGELQVFKF